MEAYSLLDGDIKGKLVMIVLYNYTSIAYIAWQIEGENIEAGSNVATVVFLFAACFIRNNNLD